MISQTVGSQTAASSPSPRSKRGALSSRSISSTSHSRHNDLFTVARGMQCIRGVIWFFFGSYPGLLLLVTGYVLGGAAIFLAAESAQAIYLDSELDRRRFEMLEKLWLKTDNVSTFREWTDITTELIVEWEEHLLANPGFYASLGSWNWLQALYFTSTSLLTIGHGDVILATAKGKGVFILYLTLGIPLAVLFLADAGYVLSVGLKYCCAFVGQRLRRKHLRKREKKSWESGKKLETVVQQKDSKAVVELIRAIHRDNNAVLMNHAPQSILMEKLAGQSGSSRRDSPIMEDPESLGETAYKERPGDLEPGDEVFSKDAASISHLSLTELPRPISPVASSSGISRETLTLRQEVDRLEISLLTVTLIMIFYVIVSSAFVMTLQSRSFFDSLYMCVVTLSTVGVSSALYPRNSNEQICLTLYALLGALLLSMCIHLISPCLRRFLKFLGKRYKPKKKPPGLLKKQVKRASLRQPQQSCSSGDGGLRGRRKSRRFSFQFSRSSKGNSSLEEGRSLVRPERPVGPWPPTGAANRRRDFALSLQLSRARQRRERHYSPRTVKYTNEIIYMYTGWKCNEVFDDVKDDDYDGDYAEEMPEVVVHTNGAGAISGSSSRDMEADSLQESGDAARDANLGFFQPETKNSDYFDSRETSSAGGEVMEGWIDIERDYSDLFACEDENGQHFEEMPCW